MEADYQAAELVITADGSPTFFRPDLNEHYHSTKGAITECLHVFIKEGFYSLSQSDLKILEVGFGTGLNASFTALEASLSKRNVYYTSLEPYPLYQAQLAAYRDAAHDNRLPRELMVKVQEAEWEKDILVSGHFTLFKTAQKLQDFHGGGFDLIYYDAFAPNKQPDMWTLEIMRMLYDLLKPQGVLVSYCAQGQFRRNLKGAGFKVYKRKGPPRGKWQMTRAVKM